MDSIIQKCATLSHIKQVQAHLLTTGQFKLLISPSRTRLLEHCALSPSPAHLPYAAHIHRHIPHPSTNDFNALLRGFARGPHPTHALSFLPTIPHPDALTFSFSLIASARALALSETSQIHSHILRRGCHADILLGTTLIDAYAKCGNLDSAQRVFDEIPLRDVAAWNALISGLAQGSKSNEALALFYRMRAEGVRINEISVLGALAACSQLGALRAGERVHACVRKMDLDVNVQVCNAVIDMYAKCGFADKGFRVFSTMACGKSVVTWNTMIMAFAMHGDGCRALELFEEMGRAQVEMDSVTYLAVLCACNHAGLVEEGVRLFDAMAGRGVSRNVKHYGSVVDLLGRAGRLDEAYRIINSMPIVPDVVLWQSLLGACKTYGNVEMAEMASRKLVEMGSNSCGDFVLLSNVYAARERWEDVGRVREAMKSRDVRKVPGFSFIEVEGVIHKFVNGDQSHPDWREIYAKLDEIRFKIKVFGYVAETSLVLHDIGEEDKENALCHHSEKLAVAFGLISTSEGTPIRVNKNLRICGDCHVVIKLISKIYGREIIVRDRARFHRFEGVIFVHDLSQKRTKTSLQKWPSEIAANGTFSAPLGSAGPCGLPVPFIVIGNKVDIAMKERQGGSSGNLVDVARQWVEKQGLLLSSEELPLTESFPGSGGLIAAAKEARFDKESVNKFFLMLIRRRYFSNELPSPNPWSSTPFERPSHHSSNNLSDDDVFHTNTSLSSDPYKYNILPPLQARNYMSPPVQCPQQPVSISDDYNNLPRLTRTESPNIRNSRSKRADINI